MEIKTITINGTDEYEVVGELDHLQAHKNGNSRLTLDGTSYEIKPKRWRNKEGKYWHIGMDMGHTYSTVGDDDDCGIDRARYAQGNYFKTQEEAEAAIERAFNHERD